MAKCTFVRKNCKGYEYGRIVIDEDKKSQHIVEGHAPSYEEALAMNNMAARGLPRTGVKFSELPWRNL